MTSSTVEAEQEAGPARPALDDSGRVALREAIRAEIARARPRPVALRTLELLAEAATVPGDDGLGLRVIDRHGVPRLRSGTTEPFVRDKAIAGVAKACKGRPVSTDDLARLGQQVEDTLRDSGSAEIPAHEVGMAILEPLKALDEVAYLRFASVYRAFESVDDFDAEIKMLRLERAADDQPVQTG